MKKQCIIVSGLPASGKSTIGKKIADALQFDFIDKDDYLERLFVTCGVGDSVWRRALSRESDLQFIHDAKLPDFTVLVSHWRTRESPLDSGTPTEWLLEQFSSVVELYCSCAIETAATRFKRRIRHPGHLDNQRPFEDISVWMAEYQRGLPLKLGALVLAETDANVLLADIIEKLEKYLDINT